MKNLRLAKISLKRKEISHQSWSVGMMGAFVSLQPNDVEYWTTFQKKIIFYSLSPRSAEKKTFTMYTLEPLEGNQPAIATSHSIRWEARWRYGIHGNSYYKNRSAMRTCVGFQIDVNE